MMTDEMATSLAAWLASADGYSRYLEDARRMLAVKAPPAAAGFVGWTAPAKERARALWVEGVKRWDIAREIGCHPKQVSAAARHHGWPSRATERQTRALAKARLAQAAARLAAKEVAP